MLILSQYEDKIVNTENVAGFMIDSYQAQPVMDSYQSQPPLSTDTFIAYKIITISEDKNMQITIGHYETKKRADEVLQEILEHYAKNEKVFKMPF